MCTPQTLPLSTSLGLLSGASKPRGGTGILLVFIEKIEHPQNTSSVPKVASWLLGGELPKNTFSESLRVSGSVYVEGTHPPDLHLPPTHFTGKGKARPYSPKSSSFPSSIPLRPSSFLTLWKPTPITFKRNV